MKKKICIVTGSRAEYGLFYPLIKAIKKEQFFKLQLIATGMHLLPMCGLTYKDIERDGFTIDAKVDLSFTGDSPMELTKSTGKGIIEFASIFKSLKPNLLVILGDRLETFAACVAAFIAKIPIAHLHGGELTEGVIDDSIRHSITKMSYLHFVSTYTYKKRVIQLGEEPSRVFKVGALGIDNIKHRRLLSRSKIEKSLRFKLGRRNALVTMHPVTLEDDTSEAYFKELISALDYFKDLKIIFTKPNIDTGSLALYNLIDRYVSKHPKKAIVFTSLGSFKYLSVLKNIDVVIGNSSSGIIEAPSFKKPTVNIGDRQKGRIAVESVITIPPVKSEIIKALKKALSPEFRNVCLKVNNPFGDGLAAGSIVAILKRELPKIKNIKKPFHDIKMEICA